MEPNYLFYKSKCPRGVAFWISCANPETCDCTFGGESLCFYGYECQPGKYVDTCTYGKRFSPGRSTKNTMTFVFCQSSDNGIIGDLGHGADPDKIGPQ